MDEPPHTTAEEDKKFHTYETHHVAWYVHAMWIGFLAGLVWYVVKFAIPMARNYF